MCKKKCMARRDVRYLIVLAGGSGTRMGGPVPKQFMMLGGKPVLRRTIDRFREFDEDFRIILVLPPDKRRMWLDYCDSSNYLIGPYVAVPGGMTRFHSVRNALKYVAPGALVAVHDGVRPFPPLEMLERIFSLSEKHPAVCPAIKVSDTLRRLEMNSDGLYCSGNIDRSGVYIIQTPQVFHSEILLDAYRLPYSEAYTDDASVVEDYGCRVLYTEGSKSNIKLTTPDDMSIAESRLLISG